MDPGQFSPSNFSAWFKFPQASYPLNDRLWPRNDIVALLMPVSLLGVHVSWTWALSVSLALITQNTWELDHHWQLKEGRAVLPSAPWTTDTTTGLLISCRLSPGDTYQDNIGRYSYYPDITLPDHCGTTAAARICKWLLCDWDTILL